MKAAVFLNKGLIRIQELGIPKPKSNEILVKVKACGICGTDLHIYQGKPGSATVKGPIILGHELAGEVVGVGDDVKTIKLGDRVTIDPNIYCGICDYCREGKKHLCENLEAIGVTRDGGMAEYVTVPEANVFILPETMTYDEGAMVEPLSCVVHGIEQINIAATDSVLIIGGGYIGQMMLQMVKMKGVAKIIVSEIDESKYQSIMELGANQIINPIKQNIKEILDDGVDIVIECIGLQSTMEQAVQLAGKGGQVLMFGVTDPNTKIEVSPYEIFQKELTIKGSFINPNTQLKALSLIGQGKINVKQFFSHSFKLDDIPEAFAKYSQLKVVKGIIRL